MRLPVIFSVVLLSLPPRGAWIEIAYGMSKETAYSESLPPRGAWIEITTRLVVVGEENVAPPTGSVD